MSNIKEPELNKRERGQSFTLVENNRGGGLKTPSPTIIESGGIAQVKYHDRRIFLKIIKVVGDEITGSIFDFEFPDEKFKDLSIGDEIKFHEANIFGYSPPGEGHS